MEIIKLINILNMKFKTDIIIVQEDPGESLSDCDKDEEEETLEEGCSRVDDEEESEDGFFVPDGYLSENEVWLLTAEKLDFALCLIVGTLFFPFQEEKSKSNVCIGI